MRKRFLALPAAIMAVAMCFGLAACTDNGNNGNQGGTGNEGAGGTTEIAATKITLSETEITLGLDGEKELTYAVEPEGAQVKVEVSDGTVVKYENDRLTAVTVGTATVSVYSEKDSSVSAQCTVTVEAPEGFKSVSASGYRFICPENWTKSKLQGVAEYYANSSTGANLNLVKTGKNDLTWTITEEEYSNALKTQYEKIGYTVKSIDTTVVDDTHLGGKRRVIAVDTKITYLGVNMTMHQQQVALRNDNYSYILTYTYVGDYEQSELSLMISQFVVK